LDDIDLRAYIRHCCTHLYVRENANTVLFVAHHAVDDFVLQCILDALKTLFNQHVPVKFSGDTKAITEFIKQAPMLTYSEERPEVHRSRVNKLKDKVDDGHDGLLDHEEVGTTLSLIARLTALFKTVEILGQILKNQYPRIERRKRVDYLSELFSGPLRALRGYYEYIERNPDYLVSEIEAALKKKDKMRDSEERRTIARQVAANFTQLISFGFLMKTVAAVSADTLLEDINEAVKRNRTPAFRLIELGVRLDSPRRPPRELLRGLNNDTDTDVIAHRLVHMFVIQHLYMFKTTEQDKQWLSSEFDIKMQTQRAVEFRGKKVKKLR
jgi:hypothetical protein